MIRALSAAILASAALLASAGASAQTAGYYVAVPAAAASKANLMTRSTPWVLKNGAYSANRAPERDQVLCQLVAKDAGQLSSFTVGGKPYGADDLAKCNARAKPSSTQMVAR